jgi:RNA polymerase sigma-70 factor (ECF subfamily)
MLVSDRKRAGGVGARSSLIATERVVLRKYIDAHHRIDVGTVGELLSPDVVLTMPSEGIDYVGREAVIGFFSDDAFRNASPGDYLLVESVADGLPAAANYIASGGRKPHRATSLDVLRIDAGRIMEIKVLGPDEIRGLGLPRTL